MSCVALPTCGLALAESERYLPELVSLLEAEFEAAGPEVLSRFRRQFGECRKD